MAWQGPAITAAATVASGLLGRKKSKTQWDFEERRYHEKNRYRWLRKGAQNAGFNPMAVLNAAGATAGNAQASASDFDQGVDALGIAAAAIGDYFRQSQQQRLVDAQIDLLEAERLQIAQTSHVMDTHSQVSSVSGARGAPPSRAPEPGPDVMTTIPHATAFGDSVLHADAAESALDARVREEGLKGAYEYIKAPPYLPTGGHMEELMGDFGGSLYGIAVMPAIVGHSIGSAARKANEKHGGFSFESGGKLYKLEGSPTWLEEQQKFGPGNLWFDFFNTPMKGPGDEIPVSP